VGAIPIFKPELDMEITKSLFLKTALVGALMTANGAPSLAQDSGEPSNFKEEMIASAGERFAPTLRQLIEDRESLCAEFDGGELITNPGGTQYVADFNGDGITDPIIDGGVFNCTTSATMFHGFSGGRMIDVFVSTPDPAEPYEHFSFTGLGNITTSLGNKAVLLMVQDGTSCDATGNEFCFAAYSWVDGKFAAAGGTVKPVGNYE